MTDPILADPASTTSDGDDLTTQPIVPISDDSTAPSAPSILVGDSAAGDDSASAPKKNPLDVLEELLNQANQVADGKVPVAGPSEEDLKKKELEEERARIERKQAEQAKIDAVLIETQKEALRAEQTQGTVAQARMQQDQEKLQQQEEKKQAEDGYEIPQLGHTKI